MEMGLSYLGRGNTRTAHLDKIRALISISGRVLNEWKDLVEFLETGGVEVDKEELRLIQSEKYESGVGSSPSKTVSASGTGVV